MNDILDELLAKLREDGWQVSTSNTVVVAERAVILAKWLLGSRRLHLKLKCRFDIATHTVQYQETATEVVRGLPPPTLSLVSHGSKAWSSMKPVVTSAFLKVAANCIMVKCGNGYSPIVRRPAGLSYCRYDSRRLNC